MIKRVCSNCGEVFGVPVEEDGSAEEVSHGICGHCLASHMAKTGESMISFIDSMDAPVFVVDREGKIVGANTLACDAVSKDLSHIEGQLEGEVFGCRFAKDPGSCGSSLHCRSCVMRNSVMHTYDTGKSCVRVPACNDLGIIAGPRKVRFYVSTEKVGGVVFLFIEDTVLED